MKHFSGASRVLLFGLTTCALLMASSQVASAALVLILAPASGPPGTVVMGQTAGHGAFITAVDPLSTYLVRAAVADGIVDQRDPRLIEVGKLVVDRAGNGHIRFVVPEVDAGPYVVMVHCPSCALYSRGRTMLPVADFQRNPGSPADRPWCTAGGAAIGRSERPACCLSLRRSGRGRGRSSAVTQAQIDAPERVDACPNRQTIA